MHNRSNKSLNTDKEEEVASIEAQFEYVNKLLKWSILDLEKFINTLRARISAEEVYVLALAKIIKNNTNAITTTTTTTMNSSNNNNSNNNNNAPPMSSSFFGDYTTLYQLSTSHYESSIEKKIEIRKEFINCLKYQTEILVKLKDHHEQRRKRVKTVLNEKNANYLNYRTRDIVKLHKNYFNKCSEYVSLQQQVLISSHDEKSSSNEQLLPPSVARVSSDEPLVLGRVSSESARTTATESLSSSPHNKKNGMSGFITQMRSQLANAAAAGDPSRLTARLAKLKKEVHDADQEYRQGIRTLESLRRFQVETAAHAIRHVEAVLLDKSDAIRAAILTISKQEQEALANESSLTKDTLNMLDQMDGKKDLERFMIEYEKLGFVKPKPVCYENYYYGQCKELLFGSRLNDYAKEHNRTVPLIVTKCIERVELLGGLEKEGIYRVSGRQSNIDLLKSEFEKDEELVELVDSKYDVFTIASVLKLYLRELKDPLFDFPMNDRVTYSKLENYNDRKSILEKSISSLSQAERDTLKTLITHLAKVEEKSNLNKMTIKNLSLMFTPAIFHDHNQAENNGDWYADKVLEDLIKNYKTLNF
ncbi:hypothetical protein RMATCC62417_05580 [Rhizopus microsporus]|nr:hypothetical protein RMATCC62417_05580 [Rhizopus microsporus]